MKQTLLIAGMALSSLVYAQNAPGLTVQDTRNTNDLPSAYSNVLKAEFKTRSVVGVPGTGNHSGMLTIAPWSDNSGTSVTNLILMMEVSFTEMLCRQILNGEAGANYYYSPMKEK